MATVKPFVSPSLSYVTLEEKLDIKPKKEAMCIGIPKIVSATIPMDFRHLP